MSLLFDLSSLSSGDLISICNKMTVRSLISLRRSCRQMDQFVIEKRNRIAVPYDKDVNICIRLPQNKDRAEMLIRLDRFLLAFAGLIIQKVYCSGVCNGYCNNSPLHQEYLAVLRRMKWNCKIMTVSQIEEEIVEIVRPVLLVIEDYSNGDRISSRVNNLELKWLTGALPDLEANLNIKKLFLKPATSVDFLEITRNCLQALQDEKLGLVDYIEIQKSHSIMSLKCKTYLMEAIYTVQEAFGRGKINEENPICLRSEISYSKLVIGITKTRRITVSNVVEEQECTIYVKIQTV